MYENLIKYCSRFIPLSAIDKEAMDTKKLLRNKKVWSTIQELAYKLAELRYLKTEAIYEILDKNLKGFAIPKSIL
jgi:hypothetical protein